MYRRKEDVQALKNGLSDLSFLIRVEDVMSDRFSFFLQLLVFYVLAKKYVQLFPYYWPNVMTNFIFQELREIKK